MTPTKTGEYEIRVAYSPHETRAKTVPITIRSGGKATELAFDETRPLVRGDRFRTAGKTILNAGEEATITISNRETDGFVIVDAIQIIEARE